MMLWLMTDAYRILQHLGIRIGGWQALIHYVSQQTCIGHRLFNTAALISQKVDVGARRGYFSTQVLSWTLFGPHIIASLNHYF